MHDMIELSKVQSNDGMCSLWHLLCLLYLDKAHCNKQSEETN